MLVLFDCFNGKTLPLLPVVNDLTEIAWKFILRLTNISWEMISYTIAFSLFPMEHMVDMLYVFYSVVLRYLWPDEQFSDSVLDFFFFWGEQIHTGRLRHIIHSVTRMT